MVVVARNGNLCVVLISAVLGGRCVWSDGDDVGVEECNV